MDVLPFKSSNEATIGTELEFQIVDIHSYALISRSKDLIRRIKESPFQNRIKPEITQSMIEINSSIHCSPKEMLMELLEIQSILTKESNDLRIAFCGGGTHAFQKWATQKIFPATRYRKLTRIYRYLSKRSTIFGQHVHIGCRNAEDALYLTHALARYVPQLIAFSASSPFYQGIDTGYFSSRSTVLNAFPLSGVIPYLTDWVTFSTYFYQFKELGIVNSMKDFYWDIRPKPEYGTVEIRVCDTPLTIKRAVMIVAYIQALALYLLTCKPNWLTHQLYYLYGYNRFQASRYGYQGEFINPNTFKSTTIYDDILKTLKEIEPYANQLNNMCFIIPLIDDMIKTKSDSTLLRQWYKQFGSFQKVVAKQCQQWRASYEE